MQRKWKRQNDFIKMIGSMANEKSGSRFRYAAGGYQNVSVGYEVKAK